MNWDISQQEANQATLEWYELWDKELNSLWERLQKESTEENKENLLADQREWIKRKEENVKEAGEQALGGSLQPQLENSAAEEMTRARVYYLASRLAETRGVGFEISPEIQKQMEEADPSLDKLDDVIYAD